MASIKKLKSGKWQAQVARRGKRLSKTFTTKLEASDWANREEYLILNGEKLGPRHSVRELFQEYSRKVSAKKKGAKWEILRLNLLSRDVLADKLVGEIGAADIADWRERRLSNVSSSTVRREMGLMNHVFNVGIKDWGWISKNPMKDVARPKESPARDRRVSDDEIELLVGRAGTDLSVKSARAIHAFRFAVETGMRAGEIVSLDWANVDLNKRVAHLAETKNGTSRSIPLSRAAVQMLEDLSDEHEKCFNISSQNLEALFRKVKNKVEISNLRFHDSRHEAVTRLAKKLDVLDLARMIGHRDIKMLMTYYNATAEELAQRLD
jgi:integrase